MFKTRNLFSLAAIAAMALCGAAFAVQPDLLPLAYAVLMQHADVAVGERVDAPSARTGGLLTTQ